MASVKHGSILRWCFQNVSVGHVGKTETMRSKKQYEGKLFAWLDHLASARVSAERTTEEQNVRLRAVPLVVLPATALLDACNNANIQHWTIIHQKQLIESAKANKKLNMNVPIERHSCSVRRRSWGKGLESSLGKMT
jgi:hypothetical protein